MRHKREEKTEEVSSKQQKTTKKKRTLHCPSNLGILERLLSMYYISYAYNLYDSLIPLITV